MALLKACISLTMCQDIYLKISFLEQHLPSVKSDSNPKVAGLAVKSKGTKCIFTQCNGS